MISPSPIIEQLLLHARFRNNLHDLSNEYNSLSKPEWYNQYPNFSERENDLWQNMLLNTSINSPQDVPNLINYYYQSGISPIRNTNYDGDGNAIVSRNIRDISAMRGNERAWQQHQYDSMTPLLQQMELSDNQVWVQPLHQNPGRTNMFANHFLQQLR